MVRLATRVAAPRALVVAVDGVEVAMEEVVVTEDTEEVEAATDGVEVAMEAAAREVAWAEQVAARVVAVMEGTVTVGRKATGLTAVVQAGHPHTSRDSVSRSKLGCTGTLAQRPLHLDSDTRLYRSAAFRATCTQICSCRHGIRCN